MGRVVQVHRHIPWFSGQMNKMEGALVGVALGFYRSPVERYGVVANFLNQLAESSPELRNTLWGLGMHRNNDHLRTLGALRNHHVHARGSQNEDQRVLVRAFRALREPEMRAEVERGAGVAAGLAGLGALPERVKRLLGPAPAAQELTE